MPNFNNFLAAFFHALFFTALIIAVAAAGPNADFNSLEIHLLFACCHFGFLL